MVGGTAWRLEDIRELHRRRYQLQERAIEIFLITGRTYLLAFNSSKVHIFYLKNKYYIILHNDI